MAKKIKKVKKVKLNEEGLVNWVISEIPNLFDGFPNRSISRTAVEKFVKEFKEKK